LNNLAYVLTACNLGIESRDELTDQERAVVAIYNTRFETARHPNLAPSDIIELLQAFGFDIGVELQQQIYKQLD